jgi:hypothetical protein
MKLVRSWVVAALALAVLGGCGPSAPPTGSYATLSGVVKDAATGLPVAGAVVSVSVVASSPTAADGKYTVYPIPAGPYTAIVATAPNYKQYNNPAGGMLAPGQTLKQDILLTHS